MNTKNQKNSKKVTETEKQVAQILNHIITASNPRVISAYESRIDQLEKNKLLLSEQLAQSRIPRRSYDQMLELAFRFLANLWKL